VSELARVAGPAGCAGLALLIAAPRRDLRLAGLALWAAALAALVLYLLPDLSRLRLAAAAAGGLALAAAGAWVLLRWPWVLAFATLACIPIRIPVALGSEQANLLLPLYGVVGALALALAWSLWRGPPRSRELGPVAWPLAALVAWTGLSLAWTDDLRKGAIFLGAFVLPFGVLAVGFARLPWRGRWLSWLWVGLVGSALAYALVGAYQWATRDVFWNPGVIVGNAYAPFFRVNSVFWDPSIYGRYLVVAILVTLAGILLRGVRDRRLLGLYAVVLVTWLGLLLSFSQSSFAALAAGVVAAAVVVWSWRAAAGLAAVSVLAAAFMLAIPSVRAEITDRSESGVNALTSGRANLVHQGVLITRDHPLQGVGVGGFKRAYADRVGLQGEDPKRAASHTTPVTVAAETGIVGLGLLAWLLAAALVGTFLGLGVGFTSRVSLAVGVALLAIAVHSLFYNAYFEDPMTWALAGLVGLAARVPKKPPLPLPGASTDGSRASAARAVSTTPVRG
jgi:putative inorganic carbon (HCO3(-)) transporter